MPFRSFTWENGVLGLGTGTPQPEFRQVDDERFVILKSFCYRVPANAPDEGNIYVVPGEDFETAYGFGSGELPVEEDGQTSPRSVVVSPETHGCTDLASVPSVFWWLIASYGNHTRATLLHDALYVDEGEPPVPRSTADRLLLTALREPGQKAGAFRHWLMWAAVSVFGRIASMFAKAVFTVHILATWSLFLAGAVWAWGRPVLDLAIWQIALVLVALLALIPLLGSSWRSGVDLKAGWLAPLALIGLVLGVAMYSEGMPTVGELSPFWLFALTGALVLVGMLWGAGVDPTLTGWLWPTALIGLPIALIPVGLILAARAVVW